MPLVNTRQSLAMQPLVLVTNQPEELANVLLPIKMVERGTLFDCCGSFQINWTIVV
jgi:hypothetical protein